jgi:hypothetical protein
LFCSIPSADFPTPFVQFQFTNRCSAARKRQVLDDVSAQGGTNPRPAFPPSIFDAELRAIYLADVVTAPQAADLVQWLQTQPQIEFAEVAPSRGIRG